MVEARSKRCLGRTEKPTERLPNEPWSSKQRTKRTTKTTLRSDRRSLLKKYLTGPTLLEMTGPTLLEMSDYAGDLNRSMQHFSKSISGGQSKLKSSARVDLSGTPPWLV